MTTGTNKAFVVSHMQTSFDDPETSDVAKVVCVAGTTDAALQFVSNNYVSTSTEERMYAKAVFDKDTMSIKCKFEPEDPDDDMSTYFQLQETDLV